MNRCVFLVVIIIAPVLTQKWETMTRISALPCECHIGGLESKWDYEGSMFIGRRRLADGSVKIGKVNYEDHRRLYGRSNNLCYE